MSTYHPTAKSYFSGAGGMDYGLQLAGIDVVQSLEIEPVFVETLKNNFSHTINSSDIRQVEVLKQRKTDLIIGTFPCTKYSTIADIHGTRSGDDLYLHLFRHLALEQPEAYALENVPGMKKFPVVMEAMSKLPNYFVHVFCPVDSAHWLPQRRPRLILIGTKRRIVIDPPRNTRSITLKDIIEENPAVEITESVKNRLLGKYRDLPIISDPDRGDIAPTCVAHYHKDRSTRLVKDKAYEGGARPYSVREYARLQGFPDSFKFSGTTNQQFMQIGNAVPIPMAEWLGGELLKYFN